MQNLMTHALDEISMYSAVALQLDYIKESETIISTNHSSVLLCACP